MSAVGADTLLARCEELAAISSRPDCIERVYLSPEHKRANALAARWMVEAGMTTWTDAAGNQCGRYEGAEPDAPALLLGSHLDTVPAAGRYDGILGVMLAIGVVSRLNETQTRFPFAVEVLAFGDEEGTRFGTALLGSRAVAGTWDKRWWQLKDAAGITLVDAFRKFGLDPSKVGDAARSSADVVGYLEAHIEQGPYLEEANRALGVVSSIAGARRFQLSLTGKAGHAGGVPFNRRRDALAGAAEAVLAVEHLAKNAPGCIATVGQLRVFPNAVNVIPGRVEFSLDLRAEFDADRDRVWAEIQQAVQATCQTRTLSFEVSETHNAPAVVAAPRMRTVITAGIQAVGDQKPMILFSKAGHDAMAIADLCDFGMLFIRCEGGVSHHPDENVTRADVRIALDAFEESVRALVGVDERK